jgi:hypothetical protein
MPITINGTGTIDGIAVGGLTDGCVATADIANSAVTPAKLSQPMTLGTVVASTSGTAIDFIGIPSWVKRITVMFNGVSTNGVSLVEIRLGTSGGFVSSGYLGASGNLAGGAVGSTSSSTGMRTDNIGSASMARNGLFTCVLLTGNTWAATSIMADSTTALIGFAGSSIALSGTLDRVRITTVNGTDTFDAGSINILYEG